MKADVCEILAHETCSESTKDKRGERVCVFSWAKAGSKEFLPCTFFASFSCSPFAYLDLCNSET